MNKGLNILQASYSPLESGWEVWNPSITGFSAISTSVTRYKVISNLVFVSLAIIGTSNATNFIVSLPSNLPVKTIGRLPFSTAYGLRGDIIVLNSGAIQTTSRLDVQIAPLNRLLIFSSVTAGTFTTSGTKGVRAMLTYQTY